MRPPRYHILAEELVRAPTAGLDTASADTYVAANRGRTISNFLTGRSGTMPLRGPIIFSADLPASVHVATTGSPGGWTFDDKVLVAGSDSKFYVANANGLPIMSAGATYPVGISLNGTRAARLGNYSYGLNASGGGIVRWDGGSVTGSLVEETNGPHAAAAIATWLDRIFVLGGSVPGTAGPGFTRNLYWTDPSWDGTDTLAKWQDDVTGLVNQIDLDSQGSDPVALVAFRNTLLIFHRLSIQALTGSSPANFSVRTVAHVGCFNADSIVVHDSGVFFPSTNGYMVFDGVEVKRVSAPVQSKSFINSRVTLSSVATGVLLDNDYLLYANYSPAAFLGLLHIPSMSWSSLDFAGYTANTPFVVGGTTDYPFILGNVSATVGRLSNLIHVTIPEFAYASAYTFQDYGGTPYGGAVESRIIELGSPEAKANLHRILVDSKPLGTTGFTVTVEALDGTVIKTVAVPSSANDWVQRTVADLDGFECEFVRLKWALTSATGPAEIQDARLEFQHEQQRTG